MTSLKLSTIQIILFILSIIYVESVMRDITTMQLTREMGIGINLGNTYESFGDWIKQWGDGTPKSYYTAWGSPEITVNTIGGYYKEGFRVLRVPVHWFNLMDDEYNISPEYMEAVKKTIDTALSYGLYVIVNIHHDERNLFANMSNDDELGNSMGYYIKIWSQIAEVFKNYDDHLIFESLNEEACWGNIYNQWSGTDEEKLAGRVKVFAITYELNQQFINVIRNSGGNNDKRHLLLAGYCTDLVETTNELFQLPNDPMNRIAISIHYYIPAAFAILTEDADWAKARSEWGTAQDLLELNNNLDLIKKRFIDNGVPVIIGEYGCPTKNKEVESVRSYIYNVCKEIYDRHMVPILWDVTNEFYNRTSFQMIDPILKDKLMSIPQ